MGAVFLATLERFTTNLGKLIFLSATVVLLGGFANDLRTRDFYFVTLVLVSYGIRSFRFLGSTIHMKKLRKATWKSIFIIHVVAILMLTLFGTHFAVMLLMVTVPVFWYIHGSESWFVIFYNTALYSVAILLAQLSIWVSIRWWVLTPGHKYPKSNELVAMLCFLSTVVAESSLFLFNRVYLLILLRKYSLHKKNRDQPIFLHETNSKFFFAVYDTTLRDGAMKGLGMNLVDYVAQEFLESRSNRELRKSLLMLDALCQWEEDRSKQSGKLLLASKREVVERLFECMSHRYYLTYRRAAISLLAQICEDENAFFAVAHVVQASERNFSLLVRALEPDINRTVLELLGKLAAFGGIDNAEPGVIADFDFARGDTHKRWKDSLRLYIFNNRNGEGDEPANFDDEQEIQSSRQKIAKNLRTLLRKNDDSFRYLANALSCSSQELQELALVALAALVVYDPSDGDLLPGYKSVIHGLFQLFRACQGSDPRGSKAAMVLDRLCRKNRQYLETLLDGSGGSDSDDVVPALATAVSLDLDHHDNAGADERSKHAMSILCGLHDQKLLSEEQERAMDIAKIVDVVTTMRSSSSFPGGSSHIPEVVIIG